MPGSAPLRLTLRTLLAYLDDTLEPAQARVIGQKVAESDAAQELIARIKQVTRRRRLTTPQESGAGTPTDPNTIAAYLDNALTGNQLEEVEEACLASDVHLAEIAACHQILTLVLGEPVLVPPTARQRMYGLVKGPEAIPFRKPPARDTADAGAEEGQEVDETLRMGLPAYSRRGGWNQPVTLLVGGLALAALLGVAIWQLIPGTNRRNAEENKKDLTAVTKDKKPPIPKTKDKKPPRVAADKSPRDIKPADQVAGDKKKKDREPTVSRDKDGAKPEKDKEIKPPTDKTAASDSPPKKDNAVGNTDRPMPEKPVVVADPRAVGAYITPGRLERPSILLHRVKDKDRWERLVKDSSDVFTGDMLVSLPGSTSDIHFTNGLRLKLMGDLPEFSLFITPANESAIVLHEPGDADLDLTLNQGRIAVENARRDKPALLRVRFANPTANSGQDSWEIRLLPDSQVAVELWSRYPSDIPFTLDKKKRLGPQSELYLFVARGQAEVKTGDTTYGMELPDPKEAADPNARGALAYIFWTSRDGTPPPRPIKALPFWVEGKDTPLPTNLAKPAQEFWAKVRIELRKALEDLAAAMKPDRVETSLRSLLRQDNKFNRTLVVRCFGAIDDKDNLLDGLVDPQYPDVRQAAVETLRHWIALNKNNDMILYDFLLSTKRYTTGEAKAFMKLLHGFSDRERNDPSTYALLIDYLRQDERPALRVLAHFHLVRLAPEGGRIPYDPMGESDLYKRGADLWKKLIPEGSLPPTGKPAPPVKAPKK